MSSHGVSSADYEKALNVGRPPNVVKLFPNSKALIVSGKVIDRAMIKKGKAMAIAASVTEFLCRLWRAKGSAKS